MSKYDEDIAAARAEARSEVQREQWHNEVQAMVAHQEQEAQARESARLVEQLRVHTAEMEQTRRARWVNYATAPDSPGNAVNRLLSGAITMEQFIPAEGWPPGESAEQHARPAPHVEDPDPPPLVLAARKMGLDI